MFAPDGQMVPGGYACREHTQVAIDEYGVKLGEKWTAAAVDEFGKVGPNAEVLEPKVVKKTKPMTMRQAFNEAQRRWGKNASVQSQKLKDGTTSCTVGVVIMGMALMVRGMGLSWEAAFSNADKKNVDDKKRMAKDQAAREEKKHGRSQDR